MEWANANNCQSTSIISVLPQGRFSGFDRREGNKGDKGKTPAAIRTCSCSSDFPPNTEHETRPRRWLVAAVGEKATEGWSNGASALTVATEG